MKSTGGNSQVNFGCGGGGGVKTAGASGGWFLRGLLGIVGFLNLRWSGYSLPQAVVSAVGVQKVVRRNL